jgi:hypothetical protein
MDNIINKLINKGELICRRRNLKHNFTEVIDKTGWHLYSGNSIKPCLNCKTPTNRIDCAERAFCCQECEDKFYKEMTEHQKEMEELYGNAEDNI